MSDHGVSRAAEAALAADNAAMPVTSPFVIVLTAAEEAVLTARVRSGRTEHRDRVRARIVLAAAGGASNAAIAAELGLCVDTARRWRRRFAAHRLDGLTDRPRSGRPRAVHRGAGRRDHRAGLHPARRDRDHRCRAGAAPNWPPKPSPAGSSSRSRRPRCAAG